MGSIPGGYRDLFRKRTFAHLSTLGPDGTPHPTPVWIDYDADANRVLVNTARGRRTERNVRRRPAVGVSMCDPEDPYRYLPVRGEATALTEDDAVEHVDALARRYMDVEEYPNHGEESGPRVVIEKRPDRVLTGGG